MVERWRDIDGFHGYQVSDLGNIRSLDRMVNCGTFERFAKGRKLSVFLSKSTGYMQVDLSGKRLSVHRIVAQAWCDGFFDGAFVDHINGDRQDNRAKNLDWVTPSENTKRSYSLGRPGTCKGLFSGDHPTAKAVISKSLMTGEESYWRSAMDAARIGYDSGQISRCCNGKALSHKGHTWRYAEVAQ